MFDAETIAAIRVMAARIGVQPAALQAVAEIESAGKAFEVVKGERMPLIRFEGHYFDRRLAGEKRAEARRQGLADPKVGGVKNPSSQAARWDMLYRAAKIDPQAAFESASYGVGQVMGSHWAWLGFSSVQGLVAMAKRDVAGQIELMVRYIEKAKLVQPLRDLDFTAFARGYNGPGYAANAYHTKMAAAYKRLTGVKPVSKATTMLRMGSKGERVRELQTLLIRAGHPVRVDADFGESTYGAVRDFQAAQGIEQDGVAGPETMRRLGPYRQSAQETPGRVGFMQVAEVSSAAKAGGALALVTSVRDQVSETATHLFGVDIGLAQTIANALMAGAGIIGLGLAGYALWGFIKSRRTVEGDV